MSTVIPKRRGSDPPDDRRVGTILCDTWSLESIVGVGGLSTVYAAIDRDGARVCVKLLREDMKHDPIVRGRFLREAAIVGAIDHPARVAIDRTFTTDDGLALHVMELVEGEGLDRLWRRLGRRLPARGALRIAHQLLDLLVVCHARGVVHCDIKPANLIVSSAGMLRVIDFGDAYAPAQAPTDLLADVAVGTPSFMAPEQVTGDAELDARVDVFAVGALLYTLLSGKMLARGRSHDESLFLAATQRAKPLAEVAPDVSDEIAAVVDRALSFERDRRFPDARSMHAAIEALLHREEARGSLDARSEDLREDVESGERLRASATPPLLRLAAQGALAELPLPQLMKHVRARALTGALVLSTREDRRRLRFVDGAPVALHGDVSGTLAFLEELGGYGDLGSYEFFIEQRSPDASPGDDFVETIVDPLAGILAVTRRFRGKLLRHTLDRLGARTLRMHPAARSERFALRVDERAVVDALKDRPRTYAGLVAASIAPRAEVDAVVYALGATHHVDVGVPGAWPLDVERS
jgi:tRNA A-37 threonylcarbamoyl transferase component Bud32